MTTLTRMTRDEILDEMDRIVDGAEGRDLTMDECDRVESLRSALARLDHAEGKKIVTNALHVSGTPTRRDAGLEEAFTAYLRTGKPNADLEQMRASQSEGLPSEGGYLVPGSFRQKIIERLVAFGGVAQVAETITTESGNTLSWPVINESAQLGEIVLEGGTFSAGADITFDSATIGAYRYAAGGGASTPIRVSVELLQDAAVNVQALVARLLGDRIARIEARHLVRGTGVAEPQGVVHGKTGFGMYTGAADALVLDDLINAVHAVDPAYRPGSTWLFNDTTLAAVRKLKDADGNMLWRPSVGDAGEMAVSGSLLGYPIVVDQAFPNAVPTSATVNFGAFGNIRAGYLIRRVKNIVIVADPWGRAHHGQVQFSAWSRMDAVVQDPNAFVALTGTA